MTDMFKSMVSKRVSDKKVASMIIDADLPNNRVMTVVNYVRLGKDITGLLNPELTDEQFAALSGAMMSGVDISDFANGKYSADQIKFLSTISALDQTYLRELLDPSLSVPEMEQKLHDLRMEKATEEAKKRIC